MRKNTPSKIQDRLAEAAANAEKAEIQSGKRLDPNLIEKYEAPDYIQAKGATSTYQDLPGDYYEDFDEYINPNLIRGRNLTLDEMKQLRYENQSLGEQFGNFAGRIAVNVIPQTIAGFSSMLDIPGYFDAERAANNEIVKWANRIEEGSREDMPIYTDPTGDTADLGSVAWWLDRGAGLTTSILSFLAQGAGMGKLVSAGMKGMSNALLASKLAKAVNPATIDKVVQGTGTVLTSAMLNQSEAALEASQVYSKIYDQGLGKGLSPSEAKLNAANAAATTMNINRLNILLNLTSAKAFLSPSTITRNILEKPSTLLSKVVREGGQESLEELINLVASKAGEARGNKKNYTFSDALKDMGTMEGFEAAFLGALGGMAQTTGSHILEGTTIGQFGVDDGTGTGQKISKRAFEKQEYEKQQEVIKKLKEDGVNFTDALYDLKEQFLLFDKIHAAEAAGNTDEAEQLKEQLFENKALKAFQTGTTKVLEGLYQAEANKDPNEVGVEHIEKAKKAVQDLRNLEQIYNNYEGYANVNELFFNRASKNRLEAAEAENRRGARDLEFKLREEVDAIAKNYTAKDRREVIVKKEGEEQRKDESVVERGLKYSLSDLENNTETSEENRATYDKFLKEVKALTTYKQLQAVKQQASVVEKAIKKNQEEFEKFISPEHQEKVAKQQQEELELKQAYDKLDSATKISEVENLAAKFTNPEFKKKADAKKAALEKQLRADTAAKNQALAAQALYTKIENIKLEDAAVITEEIQNAPIDKGERTKLLAKLSEKLAELNGETPVDPLPYDPLAAFTGDPETLAKETEEDDKRVNSTLPSDFSNPSQDASNVEAGIEDNAKSLLETDATMQVGEDERGNIIYNYVRSVEGHNLAAYLSREFNQKEELGSVTREEITDSLENLDILNPDYLTAGTELSLEVDTTYDGDKYDAESNTRETLDWKNRLIELRKMAQDKNIPLEQLDEYIAEVPIKAVADGKTVFYVHDNGWYKQENLDASNEDIAIDKAKNFEIRKAIIQKGGKVKSKVNYKSFGKLFKTKDGKAISVSDAMPDKNLILAVGRNNALQFGTDVSTALNGGSLINTKIENGRTYAVVKVGPNNYLPIPLNREKLSQKHIDSIVFAIKAHLSQDDNNPVVKAVKEQGIDLTDLAGLREYINQFTYLFPTEGMEGLENILLTADSKGGVLKAGTFLLSVTATGIEFGKVGIATNHAPSAKSSYVNTISSNFGKSARQNAINEHLIIKLASFLENAVSHASNVTLQKDGNAVVILNKNGDTETLKYTELIKQTHKTNILSVNVGTEDKPIWAYTIQPRILFDTAFVDLSKVKPAKVAQPKASTVTPASTGVPPVVNPVTASTATVSAEELLEKEKAAITSAELTELTRLAKFFLENPKEPTVSGSVVTRYPELFKAITEIEKERQEDLKKFGSTGWGNDLKQPFLEKFGVEVNGWSSSTTGTFTGPNPKNDEFTVFDLRQIINAKYDAELAALEGVKPTAPVSDTDLSNVESFETSKGSVYTVLPDGRTQRFKTATGEKNEPNDLIVFVKFKNVQQEQDFLSAQNRQDGKKLYVVDSAGNIYNTNEQVRGKDVKLAIVKDGKVIETVETSLEPKIGYNTFDQRRYEEKGEKYRSTHLGNKVTKINAKQKELDALEQPTTAPVSNEEKLLRIELDKLTKETTREIANAEKNIINPADNPVFNGPVKYVKSPLSDNTFRDETDQPLYGESMYKLTIDPTNPNRATYEFFSTDKNTLKYALSFPDEAVEGVSNYLNSSADASSSNPAIIVVQRGIVEKQGDSWVVVQPQKIAFGSTADSAEKFIKQNSKEAVDLLKKEAAKKIEKITKEIEEVRKRQATSTTQKQVAAETAPTQAAPTSSETQVESQITEEEAIEALAQDLLKLDGIDVASLTGLLTNIADQIINEQQLIEQGFASKEQAVAIFKKAIEILNKPSTGPSQITLPDGTVIDFEGLEDISEDETDDLISELSEEEVDTIKSEIDDLIIKGVDPATQYSLIHYISSGIIERALASKIKDGKQSVPTGPIFEEYKQSLKKLAQAYKQNNMPNRAKKIELVLDQYDKVISLVNQQMSRITVGTVKEDFDLTDSEEAMGLEKLVYSDDWSFTINSKSTASADLRKFFVGLKDLDENGKPFTNALGLPEILPFDEVYDTLHEMLANRPSDFNKMIEALSLYKKAYPWVESVIQKLQKAPENIKNEFVSDMTKHHINMQFIMWSRDKYGNYSLQKWSSNSSSIEQRLRASWSSNLKGVATRSNLVTVNEDDEYIFDKNVVKSLDEQFARFAADPNAVSNDDMANWLGQFGIVISDETYNDLRAGKYSNQGKKSWTDLFTNDAGLFNVLMRQLRSKQNLKVEDSELLNDSAVKALAKLDALNTSNVYSNSFQAGGKTIYSYGNNNYLINRMRDLLAYDPTKKQFVNQQLIDDLKKISFTKDSIWLNELTSNQKIGDATRNKITLSYLSLEALKKKYTRSQDNRKLNNLTAAEHEVTKLGFFQNKSGEVIDKEDRRTVDFFYLTMSDKTTMLTIQALSRELVLENGNISRKNLELLYQAAVLPEINRMRDKQASNIAGYEPNYFYFIPALNEATVTINDVEYNLRDLALDKDSNIFTKEAKEAILDTLESTFNDLVTKKLEDWNKLGIGKTITDEKGKVIDKYTFMDKEYMSKVAKTGKDTDKVKYAAMDYIFNYMIANAEMQKLFVGDPALYAKFKANKTLQENLAETFTNLGKRLAGDIAPGIELANSEHNQYYQVFLNDQKINSSNVEDTVQKEFFSKVISKFVSNYSGIEGSDAQEYTTWQEHLYVLRQLGRITDAQYEKFKTKLSEQSKGNIKPSTRLSYEELGLIMQPMKPVYVGNITDTENNVDRRMYIKSSSFPLIPELTLGLEIDKVRKGLETFEESVSTESADGTPTFVRASFGTANKVGAIKNGVKVFNADGSVVDNFSVTKDNALKLERKNFRIQQDVPYKRDKSEVNQGTQEAKLLFADFLDIKIDGETTGAELLAEYLANYEELYEYGQEKLARRLGLVSTQTVESRMEELLTNTAGETFAEVAKLEEELKGLSAIKKVTKQQEFAEKMGENTLERVNFINKNFDAIVEQMIKAKINLFVDDNGDFKNCD